MKLLTRQQREQQRVREPRQQQYRKEYIFTRIFMVGILRERRHTAVKSAFYISARRIFMVGILRG
jgi:hypothetical protein